MPSRYPSPPHCCPHPRNFHASSRGASPHAPSFFCAQPYSTVMDGRDSGETLQRRLQHQRNGPNAGKGAKGGGNKKSRRLEELRLRSRRRRSLRRPPRASRGRRPRRRSARRRRRRRSLWPRSRARSACRRRSSPTRRSARGDGEAVARAAAEACRGGQGAEGGAALAARRLLGRDRGVPRRAQQAGRGVRPRREGRRAPRQEDRRVHGGLVGAMPQLVPSRRWRRRRTSSSWRSPRRARRRRSPTAPTSTRSNPSSRG